MVFFAFSGVEARDGPGTERLKLGGEMQARAGGLQPWIMARRRRADSLLERFCTSKHVSGFGVVSLQFRRCEWTAGVTAFTTFSHTHKRFFGMAAELGSRVFKLERLGHKLATPEGTPSISLPKYLSIYRLRPW